MRIRQKCAFEHTVTISFAIRDMNMVPAKVLFTLSYYCCSLQLTLSKEWNDLGRKQNVTRLFQDISRLKFIELFQLHDDDRICISAIIISQRCQYTFCMFSSMVNLAVYWPLNT